MKHSFEKEMKIYDLADEIAENLEDREIIDLARKVSGEKAYPIADPTDSKNTLVLVDNDGQWVIDGSMADNDFFSRLVQGMARLALPVLEQNSLEGFEGLMKIYA